MVTDGFLGTKTSPPVNEGLEDRAGFPEFRDILINRQQKS